MQPLSLTIWSTYFDLASTALSNGYLPTAETMFATAVAEAENHDFCVLQQAASLHGLACTQLRAGKKTAGEILLRKAFRLICLTDQVNVADLANIACLLADCYLEQGESAKALPVLKVALSQISQRRGDKARALVPLLKRMSLIYSRAGRPAKADQYFFRARDIECAGQALS